ncbi:MAG TPA: DHH family phosphoesterase [Candidatus Saccharimonadales bacterium]
MDQDVQKFKELIDSSQKIVIIQADNPDGDSLGSSIALEQILGALGKDTYIYCAVNIPDYLKYLTGWSRVFNVLPSSYDLSIIVDTSSISLLNKLEGVELATLKTKPCVVLDHHDVENSIDFASLVINRPVVATGELIFNIANELNWELNLEASEVIATSILSDSLGLMSSATTASSIRVMADLVEAGVNLSAIDAKRRETYRKSPELTRYKGILLERIENFLDNQLAVIVIPWEEIEKYSPLYNPSMLVIEDMRLIENNKIAVALKVYADGKITGKLRANYGSPIANKIAEHFGGGGHKYASGFKTTDYISVDELKNELVKISSESLQNLETNENEAV